MNTIIKILFFAFLLLGCKKSEIKPQGIEFYLLVDDSSLVTFDKVCEDFDFNNQKIQTTSIVKDEEVLSYDWSNHTVTLSQSAYTKFKNYKDEKKTAIYPLVLTINGDKIYGLFYKYAILARSCRTTLISENDFGPTNGKMEYSIVHGQGFKGNMPSADPRGDKRIYDYLKSTGRLVE